MTEPDDLEARVAALEAELAVARDNEALFRSIIDTVPDYIVKVSTDGNLQFMNRYAPGFQPEEVIGASMFAFIDPEYHESARAALERAVSHGEIATYENVGMGAYQKPTRYFTRIAPLRHGDRVDGAVLVATDVTALAEAREEAQESHEKLSLAVDSSGVGLWSWHAASNTLIWDAATCRLFGLERAPESYAAYLERVHPEDRERVDGVVRAAATSGLFDDMEHRIVHPDGTIRWVMCRGRVLGEQERGTLRLLGGIMDVTERRELQEQLLQAQKMEAIGQLAAGIAHNFNNMLTVMLASMELAARRSGEEVAGLLDDGQQAALRAAKMVRQLMLFAGKSRRHEQRAEDLGAVVTRMVEMCKTTFGSEIQLELELEPMLPGVRCDASQVEQALLNVLINARDAVEAVEGRPRSIRVYVEREIADKGETQVRVTISDNGVGMSDEVRRRAFEPFYTTKELGRGTGLGLATTYAIVKEHGGRLECETTVGVGTSVVAFFPALDGPALHGERQSSVPPRGNGERILIVDDEELVCRVTARLLTEAGYSVETAGDGREAIQRLTRDQPRYAVVLLDQSLPELSGREVLAELRSVDPTVRVVCFSGHSAQLTGADAVLEKPAPAEQLIETVRAVLGSVASGVRSV